MPWQKAYVRRYGAIDNSGRGRVVVTFVHSETGNSDQLTMTKTTTGANTATTFRASVQAAAQARLDALRAADTEADITDQITLT